MKILVADDVIVELRGRVVYGIVGHKAAGIHKTMTDKQRITKNGRKAAAAPLSAKDLIKRMSGTGRNRRNGSSRFDVAKIKKV